jgi:hypothetical protein
MKDEEIKDVFVIVVRVRISGQIPPEKQGSSRSISLS